LAAFFSFLHMIGDFQQPFVRSESYEKVGELHQCSRNDNELVLKQFGKGVLGDIAAFEPLDGELYIGHLVELRVNRTRAERADMNLAARAAEFLVNRLRQP